MSFAHIGRGSLVVLCALTANAASAAAQVQQPDATGQTLQLSGSDAPDAADASAAQSPAQPGGRIAIMAMGRRSSKGASQQIQGSAPNTQPIGPGAEIRPYRPPQGQH